MAPKFDIMTEDEFLICKACGTQFGVDASSGKKECRICDVGNYAVASFMAVSHLGLNATYLNDSSHRRALCAIFTPNPLV